MSCKPNIISTSTKFDPEDERIFCPSVGKNGITGHGLLKKYYIPHLGINICEYCEVEEEGERRNLSYYQSKKLSRHLISELDNWKEEILRFQNINSSIDIKEIVTSLNQNDQYLENAKKNMINCEAEIDNFKKLFEEKLITFFDFLGEILLIKDLIDELKFNDQGKLNLVGIGVDKEREAKYIWMSLLFSNMKRQKLNPENFGLTSEVIRCIKNFVEFFITVNQESYNFVYQLCYHLLPEIARLENKQIDFNYEELLRRFPSTNTNLSDVSLIKGLRGEIAGLKNIISERDSEIERLNSQFVLVSASSNKESELIAKLNAKLEEINREKIGLLNNCEHLKVELKEIKISHENLFLANRELERLISEQKNSSGEITALRNKLSELNQQIINSNTSYDINITTFHKSYTVKIYELEQSLYDLQARNTDLQTVVNNLTNDLVAERYAKSNLILQVQELDELRKANMDYQKMLADYSILKEVNFSLRNQLENNLKNSCIVNTNTFRNNHMTQSIYEKNANLTVVQKDIQKLSESQIFPIETANNFDFRNTNQNVIVQARIEPRRTVDLTQTRTIVSSSLNTGLTSAGLLSNIQYADKYPKDIDFVSVDPKNLLLNYTGLYKISEWLNEVYNDGSKYKLRLLYKGVYEGFSSKKFKILCSGVRPTLTVALTSEQTLIGGYTPLMWNVQENGGLKDESGKSFIFSFNQERYYTVRNNAVAITNKEGYGPIFGKEDLAFLDNFYQVVIEAEKSQLGTCYNFSGSRADFFGAHKVLIQDIEVYEVYESS